MATLVAAPPFLAPRRVGAIENTVPVIEGGDPHRGLGVEYERDLLLPSALWADPCADASAEPDKTFEEINSVVASQVYTLVQGAKCRMLNEWDSLGSRLGDVYERGEWRALEQAFLANIVAGDFCDVDATPTEIGIQAAETVLWETASAGYLIMSIKTFYALLDDNSDNFVIDGNKITTALGTPVILIPEVNDATIYVTGPITIWRGVRSDPHPVMEVPYINEFLVLTERVVNVTVECGVNDSIVEISTT